jgi:hypothetical protein
MYLEITNKKAAITNRSNNGFIIKRIKPFLTSCHIISKIFTAYVKMKNNKIFTQLLFILQ